MKAFMDGLYRNVWREQDRDTRFMYCISSNMGNLPILASPLITPLMSATPIFT